MSTLRLELMAVILGLHLTLSILATFNIPIAQARFWSNSMNVLYWVRGKGKHSTAHSLQTGLEKFKGNLTQSNGIMWNLKRIPLINVLVVSELPAWMKAHFGREALIFFKARVSPSGRRSKLQKVWKWKPSLRRNLSQHHRWTLLYVPGLKIASGDSTLRIGPVGWNLQEL